MADNVTKAKRSEVMSWIRARGNRSTELRLIAIFRSHGISGGGGIGVVYGGRSALVATPIEDSGRATRAVRRFMCLAFGMGRAGPLGETHIFEKWASSMGVQRSATAAQSPTLVCVCWAMRIRHGSRF